MLRHEQGGCCIRYGACEAIDNVLASLLELSYYRRRTLAHFIIDIDLYEEPHCCGFVHYGDTCLHALKILDRYKANAKIRNRKFIDKLRKYIFTSGIL